MNDNKKTELSAASVVLMLLVLFIHAAAECVTGYRRDSAAFVLMTAAHRLASFPVQGFLFLSGLKLFLPRSAPFSLPRFWISRLKRVILPYAGAFAVFYAAYALTGRIEPSAPHFLKEFLTGGLATHFYYIAILMQFYLLVPLWRFLNGKCHPMILAPVSLLVTLVCGSHLPELIRLCFQAELTFNSRLFTGYLIYFVLGIIAGSRYDAFLAFLRTRRRALTVLWIILGTADCALLILIWRKIYYPVWADLWHVWTCTAAILALLAWTEKYREAPVFSTAAFRWVDRASYLVYLGHPLLILASDMLLNRIGISSLTLRFLLRSAFVFPLSILFGVCLEWLFGLFSRTRSDLAPHSPPDSNA